jgi:hypothetical protein
MPLFELFCGSNTSALTKYKEPFQRAYSILTFQNQFEGAHEVY